MDCEIAAEIRNKLQAPKTVLEKLVGKGTVPAHLVELALKEIDKIVRLLKDQGK
jgi:hypothetical protein